MTYCPWCARENTRTDICDGCHLPLDGRPAAVVAAPAASPSPNLTQPVPAGLAAGVANLTQPVPAGAANLTQPVPPPQPGPGMRMSLTGEPIIGSAPPPPPAAGVPAPPSSVPGWQPGLPSKAAAPVMFKNAAPRLSQGERWEKCFAIGFPVVIVAMVLAHQFPSMGAYFGIMSVTAFILAAVLGGTSAIGPYEENYVEVTAAVVISFLFGPVLPLIILRVWRLIQQESAGPVVHLLFMYFLLERVVSISQGMGGSVGEILANAMMHSWTTPVALGLGFFGWIFSSLFRPLNEE